MTNLIDRDAIDRAGDILITSPQDESAIKTLNGWQSQHALFLDKIVSLATCNPSGIAQSGSGESVSTSARPKRMSSIIAKLQRIKRVKLSEMQDIAGVRYVVTPHDGCEDSVSWFTSFAVNQRERLECRFVLKKEDDYVRKPKSSGYRAIHYVFEYQDESSEFNRLQFELQLRTYYQHLWAMAVETVGMFYNEALKSSQGAADWLDFFKLTSALISRMENAPIVAEYASKDIKTIQNEIYRIGTENSFFTKLSAITQVSEKLPAEKHDYWLLDLDVKKSSIKTYGFQSNSLAAATAMYTQFGRLPEFVRGDSCAVLVSTHGFRDVHEAYPSYFLDVKEFLALIRSNT